MKEIPAGVFPGEEGDTLGGDVIEWAGRTYRLVGRSLSVRDVCEQMNAQAGYLVAVPSEDGNSVSLMNPNSPVPTKVTFIQKEPGRIIHQELRGRRMPKGWAKDEVAALRSMKKLSKSEKKKRRA